MDVTNVNNPLTRIFSNERSRCIKCSLLCSILIVITFYLFYNILKDHSASDNLTKVLKTVRGKRCNISLLNENTM